MTGTETVVYELFLNIALNTVCAHAKLLTVWHNAAKLNYPEYEHEASGCVCSQLHCGKRGLCLMSCGLGCRYDRKSDRRIENRRKPSLTLFASVRKASWKAEENRLILPSLQEAVLCVCSLWYIIHNWGFKQDVLEKRSERKQELQWVNATFPDHLL